MPSTEERINARELKDKDYTNPLAHVREIVVAESKALAVIALSGLIGATERERQEVKARATALRQIMDRFPEIYWGGPAFAPQHTEKKDEPPAPQTTPTGDFAFMAPPQGFRENCPCGPCAAYREYRDKAAN